MAANLRTWRQPLHEPPGSGDRPAQEGSYTGPAVLWTADAPVVNLADNRPAQLYGNFIEQRVAAGLGKSLAFRGYASTGKVLFDTPEETGEATFVLAGRINGTAINGRIFSLYDSVSAGRYDIYWSNVYSRYVFQAIRDTSTTFISLTGLGASPYVNGVLVIRFVDGELPTAYHNGSGVSVSNSSAGSGSLIAAGTKTAIAGFAGGNADNRQAGGDYSLFARYDKALSVDDCVRLRSIGDCQRLLFEPRRIIVPVAAAGGGNSIAVPAGALSLTGFAPTVSQTANQTIPVPLGALSLTGFAPTVSSSAGNTIDVPVGALSLAGLTPVVSATANNQIIVPAGALSLTGYAPSVSSSADKTIDIPLGALSLSGLAPSVSVSGNNLISVPAGGLSLTGYAPTVTYGAAPVVTLRAGSWIRYIQIV